MHPNLRTNKLFPRLSSGIAISMSNRAQNVLGILSVHHHKAQNIFFSPNPIFCILIAAYTLTLPSLHSSSSYLTKNFNF